MIQELSISNYALIDQVRVEFGPGLNVLTGETGAGKSILIGALGLLLGNKADTEVIRTGADEAQVAGLFAVPPSEELSEWLSLNDVTWSSDEALLIRRSIRPQKRGGCSVAGQPVTRTQLEDFTGFLVDLHGQHEHQSLFSPDQHRRLLDRFAGLESDLRQFATQFQALSQAKRELEDLLAGEADRENQLFRWGQVVQDIERAQLSDPDEEETLRAERLRLDQHGRLSSALESLSDALTSGRNSAVSQLQAARQALGTIVSVDDRWSSEEQRLENALIEVEDIAETLHRYQLGLNFSPERLEEVNERLALLHALDKRYGPGYDAILKTRDEAKAKLSQLENFSSAREKSESTVNRMEQELIQAALRLSEVRQEAAQRLEAGVKTALSELGMRGAVFKIGFQRRMAESGKPVCTPFGLDQIDFLLAANQGEPLRSLRETASGGELSRVMLALKSILSEADKIPILIFDEIDTGIGGDVGLALGKYLKALSQTKQVLCITHLASIASFADHHLKVEKTSEGGRTSTTVKAVEGEARVREVARMLSGAVVTDASLEHARELLGRHRSKG